MLRPADLDGRKKRRRTGPTMRELRRSDAEKTAREVRSSAEWKRARTIRLRIDGGRCTFQTKRGRCRQTRNLDVHHVDPLRVTIENAFDVDRLRTLCRVHHRIVEKHDRAQATY
jgi:5-methylcytosine-specific restriction endonuclease McrA